MVKSMNEYWDMSPLGGKPRSYSPDTLAKKALEYFEWVKDNPLTEEKISGGDVFKLNKMRAMTIRGFCLFAGISVQTFLNYEKDERYFDVSTRVRDIIYTQKFEGASADLFNANIIARELGLVDKTDLAIKTIPEDVKKNIDEMSIEDVIALIGNGK